ncbi:hypothetical protein F4780DRAFT_535856 [Xylariomycetidae sp. FL0641]|nr:hypothetical protein F4780DRAFT_535856 [Xylariomycetidae sp. FL0641]
MAISPLVLEVYCLLETSAAKQNHEIIISKLSARQSNLTIRSQPSSTWSTSQDLYRRFSKAMHLVETSSPYQLIPPCRNCRQSVLEQQPESVMSSLTSTVFLALARFNKRIPNYTFALTAWEQLSSRTRLEQQLGGLSIRLGLTATRTPLFAPKCCEAVFRLGNSISGTRSGSCC